MKVSNYNFFYEYSKDKNKVIAYNSRTNALALMEKQKFEEYEDFVNNNKVINDDQFVDELKKGSFLIEDDFDEKKLLRYIMFKGRSNSKGLALTIAPTLNCNFACTYVTGK